MTVRLFLNGASGKMGKALRAAAEKDTDIVLHTDISSRDPERVAHAIATCDVVIDFTHHSLSALLAHACETCRKPLVMGTTGHTEAEREEIRQHAKHIPIVLSSNFSIGIQLLHHLVRKAVRTLFPAFDIHIVEAHHRMKKDAPSGTANALRLSIEQLTQTPIPVHSIRAGDIVGEHTVQFSGAGERLELTHRATDRSIFALGALRAAKWVIDQPPTLYDMQDVLGLHGDT